MVEKIARIAPVKGVDYDVGKRFDSSRQQGDDGKSDFATELSRVMNKKTTQKVSEVPEAYKLELNSLGGSSLFYFGATDFKDLLNWKILGGKILDIDKENMRLAILEAVKAYEEKEVPIGAVLIDEDGVLVCGDHNRIEQFNDSTAHAEILTLQAAQKKLNSRRLKNCVLYVTLEPCPMCAGALVLSRVKKLVYGVADSKFGAAESIFNVANNSALNHRLEVVAGILEKDCRELMQKFFSERRKNFLNLIWFFFEIDFEIFFANFFWNGLKICWDWNFFCFEENFFWMD